MTTIILTTIGVTDTTITISYAGYATNPIFIKFYLDGVAQQSILYVQPTGNFYSNFFTFALLTINTQYSIYATAGSSSGSVDATSSTITPTTSCFMKNTKILCENNVYKNIEDLNINDVVITTTGNNKIKRIQKILYSSDSNDATHKIYKLSKKHDDKLIDDLYITGGHSILVDQLSSDELDGMKKYFGNNIETIDNKFKLLACVDKRFELVETEKTVELYHILLENNCVDQQFAIYANGILSESISESCYKLNNNL